MLIDAPALMAGMSGKTTSMLSKPQHVKNSRPEENVKILAVRWQPKHFHHALQVVRRCLWDPIEILVREFEL
jgi:hypothetical protein